MKFKEVIKAIKVLGSTNALYAACFLAAQHIMVASSTIWISKLASAILTGQSFPFYLSLLLGCFVGSNIPWAAFGYNFEKAKLSAIKQYIQQFKKSHKNLPTLASDKEFKKAKDSWLTKENEKVIDQIFDAIYDTLSTCMGVFFNTIALAVAVETKILIGYCASLIISPLIVKFFGNSIKTHALQTQIDRHEVAELLSSGWDNITIGNKHNLSNWWNKFTQRWSALEKSTSHTTFLQQVTSSLTTMVVSAPVIANGAWLCLSNIANPAMLTTLVATFPRQLQLLQTTRTLFADIMNWHKVVPKLEELIRSLDRPATDTEKVLARVRWEALTFEINSAQQNRLQLSSFAEFVNFIARLKNGRLTIRGDNGAGKSSLMRCLKEEQQDKAFYLPTKSELCFNSSSGKNLSTGQHMLKHLDEIFALATSPQATVKVILLDEWDANLDWNNTKIISEKIDNLSKHCIVIEIRHAKHSTDIKKDLVVEGNTSVNQMFEIYKASSPTSLRSCFDSITRIRSEGKLAKSTLAITTK